MVRWWVCVLLSCGCTQRPVNPLSALDLDPSTGFHGEATPVAIHGSFPPRVLVDFSGNGSSVDTSFVALLGDDSLRDVTFRNASLLTATVPTTLAVGRYDLVVSDSVGRTGRVTGAFEVVERSSQGDGVAPPDGGPEDGGDAAGNSDGSGDGFRPGDADGERDGSGDAGDGDTGAAGDGPGDGDTGVWPGDGAAPEWHEVTPTASPSARWFPAATYHPPSGAVLLYGGRGGADQLWSYDGVAWTQLCDGCAPGDRAAHALEYDDHNDRVLLFGGAASHPFDPATFRNDVWVWNGATWSQLITTGSAPSPRAGAAVSFDTVRARLVVFGGETATGISDDLFELSGDTWGAPTITGPAPAGRSVAGAAFDVHRGITVIYGGDGGSFRDDAWQWDGSGWLEICAACTGTARSFVPLAYFPPRRQLLIIGGWNGDEIAGTWARDDDTFPMMSADPPKRDSMSVAYDAGRQQLVLFGGNGDSCAGDCADTWEYGLLP